MSIKINRLDELSLFQHIAHHNLFSQFNICAMGEKS